MRTWRVLLAAPALLGLAACPGPTECTTDSIALPPSAPSLVLVGQQASVEFPVSVLDGCGEPESSRPDRLSAEVYSPDNRPVENTAALTGNGGVVRFTPDVPGSYHVMASFEPVGGVRQADVLVAQERTAETVAMQLPSTCTELERTTRGTWVCDAQVVRDGKVTQTLMLNPYGALRVAVSGDVVWTVDGDTVRRYVDTDGTLVLTGSRAHALSLPQFLLASEDTLVALSDRSIQRFTFTGGTLQSVDGTVWADGSPFVTSPTEPWGFLVRAGDVLATVKHSLTDSGVQVSHSCTYQPSDAMGGMYVRTDAPCQMLTGVPAGVEDGVLWTVEEGLPGTFTPNLVVHRFALGPGGFAQQASLAAGSLLRVSPWLFRASSAPVLTDGQSVSAVVAWRPAQQDIVLEVLDRGFQGGSASSGLYWGTVGPGTRVRLRPPPR